LVNVDLRLIYNGFITKNLRLNLVIFSPLVLLNFYCIVSIMSVSIRDVAQKAGVSLGTVSNAFNRPDALAPATLKRVQKAVADLGFVPNASARTLRAGKTRVLGLVVPDISNPFFTDISKGVNDAVLAAGYVVILCNTDESSEKEDKYLDVLTSQNVQGILITPARDSYSNLKTITDRGIGLTLVDRIAVGLEACSVGVDDAQGGALALNHLTELGHRKILLLTGAENIPQVAEREKGIKEAIKKAPAGDRPDLQTIRVDAMAAHAAEEALSNYLTSNKLDITGIICGNDLVALGAIRALRAKGIDVPGEVSVIGYDDIDFAQSASVPLTSIAQPKYQLGLAAAQLAIEECEDPSKHTHQRIEFQPQLIVRNSTAAVATKKKGH
jgi:LacI family transcriptional regulator